MSPIGKKKCPYSPMQKRGLINPSPVKIETSVQSKKAMSRAKAAGFDNFDEYFKDKYGKETAEKIAQGPYPKGRSVEAGGSGDFVTSSGGGTAEVAGRRATSKEFISGMADYDKTEYINDRGEMIMRFKPKPNLVGGTVKYYEQSQRGDRPTKEISGDRFRDYLSRGTAGGKFRRPREEDIGTAGASLEELDLL